MKKPLSWFIDLYHGGQLDLTPPYQRRSVWTLKDRRFFIDTIFRKYPCPAVFLHKDLDEKSGKMIYHVIDGKQRIETILSFIQNSFAIDPGYGDRRLDGKKWKTIESELDFKDRFLNYDLAIEYIDTNDKQFINGVFDRLNRTSRKLERQELRHARYEGWFLTIAEAEAEKEEWERLGVVTKARMRRMKDVQYISELLMVFLKGSISGYNQDALDTIYADYDSPLETLPDFDESDFLNRLDLTKGYIIQMEYHNSAITKYVRGFADFYSLWAFVALNQNRLVSPKITADRYAEFMGEVIALAKAKDSDLSRSYESNAYVYLKNSVQSSTDYSQRAARNKVLDSVLLKGSAPERVLAARNSDSDPSHPIVGE
ncbi:MAG TPA: hypothetical protein DCP92_05840 [Nitrospiraceae bacterium]|jgi:hypothetical protein|nr:hypothetical protein [Nitrospiraceae bacterium]